MSEKPKPTVIEAKWEARSIAAVAAAEADIIQGAMDSGDLKRWTEMLRRTAALLDSVSEAAQ